MQEERGKGLYETPELVEYGSVVDVTLATPGGNVKGGGAIIHLDKFGEESEISAVS